MVTDDMIGNRESLTGLILKMDHFRLLGSPAFETEKLANTQSIYPCLALHLTNP
jgi:hypothetical protein